MKRFLAPFMVLLLASTLGACSSMLKSYADPIYRKATVQQLTPLNPPLPVRVEVQFQQQGKLRAESDQRLRAHVERALLASGVLRPDPAAAAVWRVTVNNVADMASMHSAGIVTGLSLGLSGAMVTDEYLFKISYTAADASKSEVFFRHLIHTAVGGVALPAGVTPLRPAAAYGQVVGDAVLAALLQLQADQVLGVSP